MSSTSNTSNPNDINTSLQSFTSHSPNMSYFNTTPPVLDKISYDYSNEETDGYPHHLFTQLAQSQSAVEMVSSPQSFNSHNPLDSTLSPLEWQHKVNKQLASFYEDEDTTEGFGTLLFDWFDDTIKEESPVLLVTSKCSNFKVNETVDCGKVEPPHPRQELNDGDVMTSAPTVDISNQNRSLS